MIRLHRLTGAEMVINAELIEMVEATPDTVISLTTGKKLVVSDTVDEVVARVMEYRRAIRSAGEAPGGGAGVG